ncbi:MAG TPA: nuclear transport factor 2 family protein, partial [Terriglobales bacterium]|nr:nuclear transport factor 2 family protein [Terriglobales bacterium]
AQPRNSTDKAVRDVVTQFEDGLKQRDLKKIEAVVAEDLVVFENGHRNDGWPDFRDNHLVPEMKEPASPSKTELIRIKTSAQLSWVYTKTEMQLTRKTGEKADAVLWSVYILEKRKGQWKIVALDWSFYVPRPTGK